MAFPDMPFEILNQIMEHTLPNGFESLSMTCKSVYIKSSPLRTKHNDLKKRYQNFSYDAYEEWNEIPEDEDAAKAAEQLTTRLQKCYTSLQLLILIADEPLIKEYMVTADLKYDQAPSDPRLIEAIVQQANESKNLLPLLGECEYFHHAGYEPEKILSHIITEFDPEGFSGVAAVIALTLLPNVITLAIPEHWLNYVWDDDFMGGESALEDLVTRANNPEEPTAGLSKLTSIVPSVAWGYEARCGLETYTPFLSIETVTSFISGGCIASVDGYTGIPFPDPPNENFGVNVEEVVLAGSAVDAAELGNFLQRLPKLKHLKISYETKWHGCGHDQNAGQILSAIESTVGDTLESLTYYVLVCYGDTSPVRSLKGFTKLKDLELDIQVLMEADDNGVVPGLGDLLPASLERFCLLVDELPTELTRMDRLFENAAASLRDLPNLKEVTIQYRDHHLMDLSTLKDLVAPESLGLVDPSEHKIYSSLASVRRNLVALGKLIEVRTIEMHLQFAAQFMDDFCDKYGVIA